MSVLGQRLLFGSLLLAGTLGILWCDHARDASFGFLLLVLLLLGLGWVEYARIVGLARLPLGLLGAVAILAGLCCEWLALTGRLPDAWQRASTIGCLLLVPGLGVICAFRRAPSRAELQSIALATLGIAWLLLPGICALNVRAAGELWALLLILVVKGNDIGAYLVGRKWGRTPLTRISPKKTWEGAVGGLLLGTAAALGVCGYDAARTAPLVQAAVIGVAVGVAGQVGDLAESYLKRSFEVKDSGRLIPAFGGVLDLLDSLLFGAPTLFMCLRLWG